MGIKRQIVKAIKWARSIFDYTECDIIQSPEKAFRSLAVIKEDTSETMVSFPSPGILDKAVFEFIHSKQSILEVPNCIVTPNSDIVQIYLGNSVLWDKYYQKNFSKIIPLDSNLCSFSILKNQVKILKSHRKEYINGSCISLLGVHAHIWAHFIVQFYPKLCYAKSAGLLNGSDTITLLVPDYCDSQVSQIVSTFIKHYPHIHIKVTNPKVSYFCERLYYIPSACYLSNHAKYLMACDCVIPQLVYDQLKTNLVKQFTGSIQSAQNRKIYLVRRNTYRSLINFREVEDFFVKQGFVLIEPHLLSLEEKIALFYSAEYIVGPYSSAWTNIMFCQKGAKGMILSNLVRMEDLYLPTMAEFFGINISLITGISLNSDIHSDYYIPLSDIKQQYQTLAYGK